MSKVKSIMKQMYVNELLKGNLKVTSKEESDINDFVKQLRQDKVNTYDNKNIVPVLDMINKLKVSEDTKYKYAYTVFSGFSTSIVFKSDVENLSKDYPFIQRPLVKNSDDTWLIPNQIGGAFTYKFIGTEDNKYVFKNVDKEWQRVSPEMKLTKEEVITKVKDDYAGMKPRF